MEKKRVFLTMVLSIVCAVIYAQVPPSFSYQAVARHAAGGLIMNQDIGVRIGIMYGTPGDTAVYIETHSPTSNAFGLFNLEIGKGTPVSGAFSSIDWAAGPYFLRLELDETGGTDYVLMDSTQLMSVPYALYSGSTGDTSQWQKSDVNLYYNNGYVGIGTNTPVEKLDVEGNIRTSGSLQLGTTLGIAINDTCTAVEAGMIIFNGTNFCACDGTTWKKVD